MKTDAEIEAMFPIVARRHPMGSEKIVRFAVFLAGYSEEKMMLSEWTTHDEARHFQSVCMTAFRVGWNACMEAEKSAAAQMAEQTRLLREASGHPVMSTLAADMLSNAFNAAMSKARRSSSRPPNPAPSAPPTSGFMTKGG